MTLCNVIEATAYCIASETFCALEINVRSKRLVTRVNRVRHELDNLFSNAFRSSLTFQRGTFPCLLSIIWFYDAKFSFMLIYAYVRDVTS